MKKFLIFCLACGLHFTAMAQYVTQSAEGKGSVLLPLNGSTVGFDIGKTEISAGLNNYGRAIKKDKVGPLRNWFYGLNLAVKNSAGTGNLFKNGEIIPEGNFLGFLGLSINNNDKILSNFLASNAKELTDRQEAERKKILLNFKEDAAILVEAAGAVNGKPVESSVVVKNFAAAIRKTNDILSLIREINIILADTTADLSDFVVEFKRTLAPRRLAYNDAITRTHRDEKITEYGKDFAKDQTVWRVTPFLFGGIDARNFSLYKGLSTTSLANSFVDTLYRGGQFGLGLNVQVNTFWLGITYAYVDGDNFVGLNSKEYTLRTTDSLNNQALISEKKITGYSGAYSKVKRNELNIDLLKEFQLSDTSRVIANVYYRGSLYSRNTDYLKDFSNVGLGLYFLGAKSKFLGGLYVEVPDLNNNIEKAKPVAEQNIRGPFKRLTFGIITKFAINSVFGFKDRARKPD